LSNYQLNGGTLQFYQTALLVIDEHSAIDSRRVLDQDNKGWKAIPNALKGLVIADDDQFSLGVALISTWDREKCCHIGMEFPEESGFAEAQMRRLVYLGKAVNDGRHYFWPGCAIDMDMIAALDFMRGASGAEQPFFCLQAPPCKLAFSVYKHLACGVFFPKPGEESAYLRMPQCGRRVRLYRRQNRRWELKAQYPILKPKNERLQK
jgi:hypothetical protein